MRVRVTVSADLAPSLQPVRPFVSFVSRRRYRRPGHDRAIYKVPWIVALSLDSMTPQTPHNHVVRPIQLQKKQSLHNDFAHETDSSDN